MMRTRGGAYRVLVGGEHPSVGEFVEVVPDEKVVFTFGWDEPDHPIPSGSTRVEITLIPEGGKTVSASSTVAFRLTPSPNIPEVGITTLGASPSSAPVGTRDPMMRYPAAGIDHELQRNMEVHPRRASRYGGHVGPSFSGPMGRTVVV